MDWSKERVARVSTFNGMRKRLGYEFDMREREREREREAGIWWERGG